MRASRISDGERVRPSRPTFPGHRMRNKATQPLFSPCPGSTPRVSQPDSWSFCADVLLRGGGVQHTLKQITECDRCSRHNKRTGPITGILSQCGGVCHCRAVESLKLDAAPTEDSGTHDEKEQNGNTGAAASDLDRFGSWRCSHRSTDVGDRDAAVDPGLGLGGVSSLSASVRRSEAQKKRVQCGIRVPSSETRGPLEGQGLWGPQRGPTQ